MGDNRPSTLSSSPRVFIAEKDPQAAASPRGADRSDTYELLEGKKRCCGRTTAESPSDVSGLHRKGGRERAFHSFRSLQVLYECESRLNDPTLGRARAMPPAIVSASGSDRAALRKRKGPRAVASRAIVLGSLTSATGHPSRNRQATSCSPDCTRSVFILQRSIPIEAE
jgi:hypothetical protein